MISRSSDTIFAAASGFGRAAVTVVRISGPGTGTVLEAIAGGVPAQARRMSLRTLRDPGTAEPLDQALVVWMPGPHSFTGEDQAELQIHGGLAVRAAVLRALARLEGCRPAEAGEFTRRAFLNGRMDLSRVEGLADLIDAETEAQRRQALRQLEGRLGDAVEAWREEALQILALLEAALDFSDEGDVPETLEREAAGRIGRLRGAVAGVLEQRGGERLREGFVVVLAGAPNAGKSTLLNALAQREVAIVSPVAGTTRDAIEVRCDLGGLPVVVVDTAGLRDGTDPVEREGVARARARAAAADLVLWLVAPGESPPPHRDGTRSLVVRTKADLDAEAGGADLAVSARTGAGMASLLERIATEARLGLGGGDAVITRERHRAAFEAAEAALSRAGAILAAAGATELAAEEVRLATRAIGRVTGRVDVEDVLDRLFASFCIGK
ncbi:MAG TPA: tRNA uridine-5-carboxymethylaminomethyl(34) synthesis GTPase MnmE [Microvirga sp.]|nr:tRNA uridine-5-carboxymethylaminomethyl(34) synthesis GTPase MnmE [Microvirga sp.]